MYYTERKPKNKKRGRPGNEASFGAVLEEVAIQVCKLFEDNMTFERFSRGCVGACVLYG